MSCSLPVFLGRAEGTGVEQSQPQANFHADCVRNDQAVHRFDVRAHVARKHSDQHPANVWNQHSPIGGVALSLAVVNPKQPGTLTGYSGPS